MTTEMRLAPIGERRFTTLPVRNDRRLPRRPVRVLVVEHDPFYRRSLHEGLDTKGYAVELAHDAADAMRRFILHPPDIVIIDVLLPDTPATDLCQQMGAIARVPVIMVTSVVTTFDLTRALDAGAADYVARPNRMRELAARIEAVRRPVISPPPWVKPLADERTPSRGAIEVGSVRVDFDRHQVKADGVLVHLPRREFDLLALLLSPPGRLRTRSELIERLWSGRDPAGSRTLDTHIRRLRVKLERDPARGRRLVTVRGVGFRYDVEPVEQADADDECTPGA
jgi:two-component system response regulator RegX3